MNGGDSVSVNLKHIDEIQNVDAIKGVEIRINWSDLEPSKGSYNFSMIDTYLSRVKAYHKYLVIHPMDRKFNSSSTSFMPSYLLTSAYHGGVAKSRTGNVARLWDPVVMDRLIALYRAMGSKYNGDPSFEGITTDESTLSLPSPLPSGYSDSALELQYERLISQVRPSMPNTALFLDVNWLGSLANVSKLEQSLVSPAGALNSSNTVPNKMNNGQTVWTGGGTLGADYRGRLAIASAVETGELGGNLGDFYPWQIANYAYSTLKANYVFWVRNTWSGNSGQRWDTGILPYLKNKNPSVRTGCPISYGYCIK
jgi:hypothetical protein